MKTKIIEQLTAIKGSIESFPMAEGQYAEIMELIGKIDEVINS